MSGLRPQPDGVVVFLGAGFSYVAGVPLAAHLLDAEPRVDRISRQRLVDRVQRDWKRWHAEQGGAPEEYLAKLEAAGGAAWSDAVWYVGLVVALQMGRVEQIGTQDHLTVTRHNIDRTTQNRVHEMFWTTIFRRTFAVTVITTNYDILAERGLRVAARPRVPRPGFHYGFGPLRLEGGGYPSYAHIQRVTVTGSVPLLKLHGSVSWSERDSRLMHYHDCRPAIRGDALLVAPVRGKRPPESLQPIWDLARAELATARLVVCVGYSLPPYDDQVRNLLAGAAQDARIHVFDPNQRMAEHYGRQLDRTIVQHPGLPNGLPDLEALCEGISDHSGPTS
jgi:hypothetical protein